MKRIVLLICLTVLAGACFGEGVEYVLVTGTNTLDISANQSVAYMTGEQSWALVWFGTTGLQATIGDISIPSHREIDGPVTVNLDAGSTQGVFKVVIKDGSMSPANTIVIPSDHHGPVNIKLECSSDMVNWDDVSPGVFETGVSNRFFRVKGIRQ